MTFEKLKIAICKIENDKVVPDPLKEEIKVLFNPNTYTITKTVTWNPPQKSENNSKLNAPPLSFGGGGSRHLTMDLFFDVTEQNILNVRAPILDVRTETDKIVRLTRIERDRQRPPVCQVRWGEEHHEDFPFNGVISNLTQRFVLFREDGTPVRATLTVDFLEFLPPQTDKKKTDPEQTAHTIKRGETLSSIAGELYHDPTLWRIIAEANGVDNPRGMLVGRTLAIPRYGQG